MMKRALSPSTVRFSEKKPGFNMTVNHSERTYSVEKFFVENAKSKRRQNKIRPENRLEPNLNQIQRFIAKEP